MRLLWLSIAVVGMLAAAPDAAALQNWCAPEFQSCGPGSGEPGMGSVPGGNLRDGVVVYGARYWQCSSGPRSGSTCWECGFNPRKNTRTCFGVTHMAACECRETVQNYVTVSCEVYGACTYADY